MADAEATVLLKVKADSSQAVKDTDKFTDSQKRLGTAIDTNTSKISQLAGGAKSAFDGLGSAMFKLNQGLEVIDKVIRTVDKAVDAQLVDRAKQFGMQVKNASDAAEQFHKALAKNPAALDETTRGLLKTREAMDDLGKYTQQVVATVVVPLINEVVDRVKDLIEYGSDFIDLLSHGGVTRKRIAQDRARTAQVHLQGTSFAADVANSNDSTILDYDRQARGVGASGISDADYAAAMYGSIGGSVGTGTVSPRARAKVNAVPVVVVGVETGGGQLGGVFGEGRGIEGSVAGGGAYDRFGNPVSGVGSAGGLSFGGSGLRGLGGLVGNDRGSFVGDKDLAGMADPLARLKERLGDTTTTAGAAYATLAGGITAAVDAAITGSDSIGKAAAKASASVLKSLAVEATGRAVFEGALAIGSLAIQDYKGAATHGLAAAKFAAAAAVTGSLAAGLGAVASGGGGGGSASAGPAGGGFGSPTGGSSSSAPINIVVNVGAGFANDPQKLGDTIARAVRSAQLKGTRGNYATEVSG